MTRKDAEKKYNQLFETEHEKAEAFDKIAENFYFMNFATMSKADYETLIFSLYLEQILKKSEAKFEDYSDYSLSKTLGISQSRISALKVRKELQYPYEGFDWKESFKRISDKAVYEGGKIKLFIPDRNLYLEIKNVVEMSGGYIEMQLTSNLLQIRPEYFIDLVIGMSDEADKEKIKKEIAKNLKQKNSTIDYMESKSFGQQFKDAAPDLIIEIVSSCLPYFGGVAKKLLENIFSVIKRATNK